MRRTGVNGRRVSVPSFGDSFFILSGKTAFRQNEIDGFRPLIRGFFFYKEIKELIKDVEDGFRPLIRGFFFYPVVMICRQV